MGSWSVYCGISKITISAGRSCVLLPLRISKGTEGQEVLMPFTLPIFGEYDDYGGIENIEKDWNTALIEATYGISIEHFCALMLQNGEDLLTNGFGDEVIPKNLRTPEVKALVKQPHTWIDRKVYDLLITPVQQGYNRVGDYDMGSPAVLTKLGFTPQGKVDDERFNQLWVNGEYQLASDGTWAHPINTEEKSDIYGFYSIKDVNKLMPTIDTSWFANRERQHLYELWTPEERLKKLYWILSYDRGYIEAWDRDRWELMHTDAYIEKAATQLGHGDAKKKARYIRYYKRNRKLETFTPMQKAYLPLFAEDDFCRRCADLISMKKTMRDFSGQFEDFVEYITPQCGEYRAHQRILDGFAAINQEIVNEYEEEDEEE